MAALWGEARKALHAPGAQVGPQQRRGGPAVGAGWARKREERDARSAEGMRGACSGSGEEAAVRAGRVEADRRRRRGSVMGRGRGGMLFVDGRIPVPCSGV